MAQNNEIIIRGRECCVIPEDVLASAAIKPGEMVEVITAVANRGKLRKAAAGSRTVLIADRKLRGSIEDDYEADEPVRLVGLGPGVEFLGFVTDNNARVAGRRLNTAASGSHVDTTAAADQKAELVENHTASASMVRRHLRRL